MDLNLLHPAIRDLIEVLPVKLAKADSGQLYSPSGSGIAETLYHSSSANLPPCSSYIRKECYVDRFRGAGYISKRCNNAGAALHRLISEPCIFVDQRGWWQQPSNKSEKKLNQNIEYQHYEMEGIQSLKSLIQRGDFMVKLDLKEAYFSLLMHLNSGK